MKPITIDQIDYTLPYEGYIWYSGQTRPEMINGTFEKSSFEPLARPNSLFIVEGNLYAHELKRSISIRNVDGQYQIYQADLAGINTEQLTSEKYRSRRLNGVQYVKIVQYWDEVTDELVENMPVLVPAWIAFVGFVK